MRTTGTTARGIRAPMIRPGDELAAIVADSVLAACENEGFVLRDRDVVGVTEAVAARAQGNFATAAQIAADIRAKFPAGELAVLFPILSRNRFGNLLKGIAAGCKKLTIVLSYPSDEVGNQLIGWDAIDAAGINPYTDVLDEKRYRALFGYDNKHPFTGLDYAEYYKSFGRHIRLLFANDPRAVLDYTKHVLCCDIHTRHRTKRILRAAGAETVFGLDDILTAPVEDPQRAGSGSGWNAQYGLLGSNKATADSVKLFPRDCDMLVVDIQRRLFERTGKTVEVMVYGDGAFKDPAGGIWELADPVVSPAYTAGLDGTPNELKIKYLLDNELAGKSAAETLAAMKDAISHKAADPGDRALGTTPRRFTDLLGSLCDLMSGSGDKGTPIVLVSGYFDNYADT
ncbi:MAG: coenzyme F420-0:L-glutamate ligase [Oscillospiraceae bacterium]|nr:coenzyme F420-0:L-glutamate ligase [Oscillospiraceae bacterium]